MALNSIHIQRDRLVESGQSDVSIRVVISERKLKTPSQVVILACPDLRENVHVPDVVVSVAQKLSENINGQDTESIV